MIKAFIIHLYIILCLLLPKDTTAEMSSYASVRVIVHETEHFKIIHFHDFSYRSKGDHYNVHVYGPNAVFSDSLNKYSFIILIRKSSGDTLFQKPCPALTDISVVNNEKYIVGLSEINNGNPYKFVIFDTMGRLIYKKEIGALWFKLSDNDLKRLINQFPFEFNKIIADESINRKDDYWEVANISRSINDTLFRNFLHGFPMTMENSSILISQSYSHTPWYDNDKPNIIIGEKEGSISEIKINGERDDMVNFKVNKLLFDRNYFLQNGYIGLGFPKAWPEDSIQNNTDGSKRSNYPYLQLGNLYYNYATLDSFLKQDEMIIIDPDKIMGISEILSLDLFVTSKDSSGYHTHEFKIKGTKLPKSVKNEIRKIRNVVFVTFERVIISCRIGNETQKRFFVLNYTILP